MRTVLAAVLLLALAASASATDPHPIDRAPEFLARVIPHVERACATRFQQPPRVVELTEREAMTAFARDLSSQIERRFERATPGQRATMLRLEASASVRSCLARYSFAAGAIVLVRTGFDRQREAAGVPEEQAEALLLAVLAHEAVHALDDERFDLAALYADAPDEDALRARAMVAEGRAVHFGRIAGERLELPARIRDLLPGGDRRGDPGAMALHLTYRLGTEFVGALVEREGIRLADRALREPPEATHLVCQPRRWPARGVSRIPAEVLRRAKLEEGSHAVSELLLRARHAALRDPETAARLFAGFRGGRQVLTQETNAAVLVFATEEDARRYVTVAGEEAPTRALGTVVVRAFGEGADDVLPRLLAAVPTRD